MDYYFESKTNNRKQDQSIHFLNLYKGIFIFVGL